MKKRYDVLGVDVDLMEDVSAKERYDEDFYGLGNHHKYRSQLGVRRGDIVMCVNATVFQHLGFDISHLGGVEKYIREGIAIANDYFFGDYLRTNENAADMMRKAEDNEGMPWFELYRDGLHLAQLAQDADA